MTRRQSGAMGPGPAGRAAVLCWPLWPRPHPFGERRPARGHFYLGPRCLVLTLLSFSLSVGPRTRLSSDPPSWGAPCHQLPVAKTRGASGRLPALGPHCTRPPLASASACCSWGLGPRSFQPWPAPSPRFSCVLGETTEMKCTAAPRGGSLVNVLSLRDVPPIGGAYSERVGAPASGQGVDKLSLSQ